MGKRPKVITKCVADTYAGANERIIEWTDPATHQGGLICIRADEPLSGNNCTVIELYSMHSSEPGEVVVRVAGQTITVSNRS